MHTPANVERVDVDAWKLRCIFNRSMLVARVAAGELVATPKTKGNPSSRPYDPPGTKSQMFLYRDSNGDEVATVHFYHVNGKPRSEPDPKTVTVGKRRYVIYSEALKAEPERKWLKSEKWLTPYRCMRRLQCCLFGALDSVPLAE